MSTTDPNEGSNKEKQGLDWCLAAQFLCMWAGMTERGQMERTNVLCLEQARKLVHWDCHFLLYSGHGLSSSPKGIGDKLKEWYAVLWNFLMYSSFMTRFNMFFQVILV